jgi:DNA helicase MCM8
VRGGGGGRGGGRGGTRESGLHQLYLDVISVEPLRKGVRKRGLDEESTATQSADDTAKMTEVSGTDGEHNREGDCTVDFSRDDLRFIRELALSPHCVGLMLSSFCTIIFGHDLVKMGLLLGLFGGSSTEPSHASKAENTAHAFHARSDIHVLVVGDPGLGKSQMLRAAATVAPRSVMVCGNTSSTAGLTVSVVKEPGGGGDMCLEAGKYLTFIV